MEHASLLPQQRIEGIVLLSEETTRRSPKVRQNLAELLEQDLESVQRRVREALGLRRRELQFAVSENSATLTTPLFEYTVRIEPRDPDETAWVREVSFTESEPALRNTQLLETFADRFDSILIRFGEPLEIESWIDRIEERQTTGMNLDYDLRCTWCEFSTDSTATVLRMEGRELRVGRKPGTSVSLHEMADWVTSLSH